MILTPDLEEVGRRVRLLRDRVLVKPLPYVHPVLATPTIEIQKGVVIAVGYGRRTRRLVRFDKDASHLSTDRAVYFEDGPETGEILPMQVKPGDVVEFSFRNLEIINFDRLGFWDIGNLVMIWQNAIYSIDSDESLSECLLWQRSAGYDRHGNWMSGAEDWHRA